MTRAGSESRATLAERLSVARDSDPVPVPFLVVFQIFETGTGGSPSIPCRPLLAAPCSNGGESGILYA
jgi:hypothetical protein